MKKVLLGFAIGICITLFANKKTVDRESAKEEINTEQRDTTINCGQLLSAELVNMATANKWRLAYESFRRSLKADSIHIARSFIFQTEDLLMALGLPKPKKGLRHVRVYFGITDNGGPKLMFVGVDGANLQSRPVKAGTDVYFKCKTKGHFGDKDVPVNVLDLNYPCPTACPE